MAEEAPAPRQFIDLFNQAKEFAEELLAENKRLKHRIDALEQLSSSPVTDEQIAALRQRLEKHAEENRKLLERYRETDHENREFVEKSLRIEKQNDDLASLYAASYQLHSTLDFMHVVRTLEEIVVNLVGAEHFSILLRDDKSGTFQTITSMRSDEIAGLDGTPVRAGQGRLGEIAARGENFFRATDEPRFTADQPLAVIPLKLSGQVIGLLVIWELLEQKTGLNRLDHELLDLLAAQAASALFAARIYAVAERKLTTIQGFLDLMTTG